MRAHSPQAPQNGETTRFAIQHLFDLVRLEIRIVRRGLGLLHFNKEHMLLLVRDDQVDLFF